MKKTDYRNILIGEEKKLEDITINNKIFPKLKSNIFFIEEKSNKIKIASDAVIGIILAEHSLHNSPANYFEELYVKKIFLNKEEEYLKELFIATKTGRDKKKLKGESEQEFLWRLKNGLVWSIGICQISIFKAYEIEKEVSKKEDRVAKSIKQVIEELLDDKKNIEYCLLELKNIRDRVYDETLINLSNNPEIIGTLYNTGKVDTFIKNVKQANGDYQPKPNRFGTFIKVKRNEIKKIKLFLSEKTSSSVIISPLEINFTN